MPGGPEYQGSEHLKGHEGQELTKGEKQLADLREAQKLVDGIASAVQNGSIKLPDTGQEYKVSADQQKECRAFLQRIIDSGIAAYDKNYEAGLNAKEWNDLKQAVNQAAKEWISKLAERGSAMPEEEMVLSERDEADLSKFSKGIESAFDALGKAGSHEAVAAAFRNLKQQADGIAQYEMNNPSSKILEQARAMRLQCEAFLIRLETEAMAQQAEGAAKEARADTHGVMSGMRVLNAIPKLYRTVSGDENTLTYSEARANVTEMRSKEVRDIADGASVVSEALSRNPPVSIEELRGASGQKLEGLGLVPQGANKVDLQLRLQSFLASPEGQRLALISRGRLTREREQALLKQQAERGKEAGSTLGISNAMWEKTGDFASSMASLDMIALTLVTGGGALVGRLAAKSVLAVRAASALSKGVKTLEGIKGLGVAVRGAEKVLTMSPAELKALKAMEFAGNAEKIAKALARGTLSLSRQFAMTVGAAAAAETLVPGSGHAVMAACFVMPGAFKEFGTVVGKNAAEILAKTGGNMMSAEMQGLTKAYLLYLKNTKTQAQLATMLTASLKESGVADAEKAAGAFVKDLFKGETGKDLKKLAVSKKQGPIAVPHAAAATVPMIAAVSVVGKGAVKGVESTAMRGAEGGIAREVEHGLTGKLQHVVKKEVPEVVGTESRRKVIEHEGAPTHGGGHSEEGGEGKEKEEGAIAEVKKPEGEHGTGA